MNILQTAARGVLALGLFVLASPSVRSHHKAAPVPPTMEIELLDPKADPRGMPAVVAQMDPLGVMKIDIPQSVLVHKYYYTGDRTFQAQFIPGGPTIVVVNHPRTGERLYIPVNMLPGAPRVHYTHHAIEYDFGHQGVNIRFCCLGGPKVAYRHGETFARKYERAAEHVKETSKDIAARTGITEACLKVKETTKNVATTSLDTIGNVSRTLMIPVQRAGSLIPGSQMVTSAPEDRATNLRDAKVRAAEFKNQFKDASIPSNR